jgi:calpain-15
LLACRCYQQLTLYSFLRRLPYQVGSLLLGSVTHSLISHSVRSPPYQVRLCFNGQWTVVTVDDYFPADRYGRMRFANGRDRQLWPSLIEKAAAKLYGSYAAISGGMMADAFALLTGCPAEHIDLAKVLSPSSASSELSSSSSASSSSSSFSEAEARELLWSKLCSFAEANCVMGASGGATDTNKLNSGESDAAMAARIAAKERAYAAAGLNPNPHAYSLLAVAEVRGSDGRLARLVKLRDPHARSAYAGA